MRTTIAALLLLFTLAECQILGGRSSLTQKDLDSDTFKEALAAGLEKLEAKSRGFVSYSLQKVLNGTSQVGQGVLYKWTMTVRRTKLPECEMWCDGPCERIVMYSASAWIQPWLSGPERIVVMLKAV
ncbi:unnamed protein product [Dibothriocephalus latus]|uniref:Uncharacterized protein n=1 Tax=Dibothriocephalus latus TaxID=60516 RepID=A0A3P7LTB4_DIBLA|nr:unnamed protein product [Dibothriocephalus latus]